MNISRREVLLRSLGGLGLLFPPVMGVAETQGSEWEKICQQWMQILLPADEQGPGADSHEVWDRINQQMESDSGIARWFRVGFSALEQQPLPQTETELEQLMNQREPAARFLSFFQRFLLDSYYGTAAGWNDLGLANPPQPGGFQIAT